MGIGSFNTLAFEMIKPAIGLLTLNRPDRLNAMSAELIVELHSFLDQIKDYEECRVVIIKGAGRGFCSGADLKDVVPEHEAVQNPSKISDQYGRQKSLGDLVLKMRRIPQPIIAAVHGPAAGGGLCLALAADIRIAGESARFIASFINVGLSAGELGSSFFLPRQIGFSRAAEILYTGRTVGAVEAERTGLVSRLVPDDQVLDVATEIADAMVEKSLLGLKFTKELLNASANATDIESLVAMENRSQVICMLTGAVEEAKERFRAKNQNK
ncbi:MAG: enoyl-CoA hydratase/isomerase family protein, partial [Bacillota bacterium]